MKTTLLFALLASSQPHNVFGPDDREPITSTAYPWSTIGRLDTGCTGTLVGPDLVLTAGHCVIDEDTGKPFEPLGAFRPNLIGGIAPEAAAIVEIIADDYARTRDRGDDWAILRLDRKLGDKYGTMDVEARDDWQLDGASISLAGYSGDYREGKTAGVHRGCRVRHLAGALFHHDCDMTRGASGGPVFVMRGERAAIVGVNVSEYRWGDTSLNVDEYSEQYSNHAVPTRTFKARFDAVSRTQPGGDEIVKGYLGLDLVRVGPDEDIGVKVAYEPCYAEIRRRVEIPPQSYMFPYSIYVNGTREELKALIRDIPCTDRVYEIVGEDLELLADSDLRR